MPAITLAEAMIRFVADQAGLRTELAKSEEVAKRGAFRIGDVINKRIAEGAKRAGKALSVSLTAPLLGLGAAAARAAVGIDNAFSTIRRQTGATGRELAALRADFRDVFGDVDESAEEVARVLSDLNTRLGLTGGALRESTKSILDFADVTGDDAAEATRAVTRLLNAMGISASQIPEVLDKLTAAGQRTGISANRLAELVARAGPAFQALGFDLERTIALLAQFERAGADPEQVVQSLNILFRQFAKAGIRDAGAAFDAFLEKIRRAPDLVAATGVASDVFGRQALSVAKAVRSGAFEIDGLARSLRASQGVLRQTAAESEQFGEKLGRLRNRLTLAFEPLGRILLDIFERNIPALERMIQRAADLANAFAALPPRAQSTALAFTAILAIAGPVLIFFGAVLNAILKIAEVVPKIGPRLLQFAGFLLRIAPAAGVATLTLGLFASQAEKMELINRALREGMTPKLLPSGFQNDARLFEQAYNTARAFLRVREELARPAAIIRGFPAETFRKRTVEEEARGLQAPKAPGRLPGIVPVGAGQNVALQRALRTLDLLIERDRLSTAEQMQHLEQIRARYARNAEERMDLDIRIFRLKAQLAEEEDALLDRPRRVAEARFEAEARAIDDVLSRLKDAADAGDVDAVIRLLDQWRDRLPDIARGYIEIARQAREATDAALAAAVATIARPERVIEGRTGPEGFIEAARQRLEELGTVRIRNIDLIQREISQLQIIAEQEGKREQQLTDEEQIREARLNRLQAEADIDARRLEIARLRVDDARALLDLTQLEQSFGLATAAQVDAARRQALAALQAQLATAKALNATQAELVPILQDILILQEDLIRGDLLASLRQAIAEIRAETFDFLTAARQFFQDLQQGIAGALRGFALEGKTVLETLGNLARAVFDAAFTQVTNHLAQQLTQVIAGFLGRLIPGLGGAAPDAGLATATAITTSGASAAAAITTSGISAATAITTSGVSLATAITAAGTAMSAAIVAAGAAAAAAIAAAVGAGAGLGAILGLQHGGIVTRPMLATIAEAGRPEMVLPIPQGLNLREMAGTMRMLAEGGIGGGTVIINNPVVRNDDDIHRIGRSAADALRIARRGNHPLFREKR